MFIKNSDWVIQYQCVIDFFLKLSVCHLPCFVKSSANFELWLFVIDCFLSLCLSLSLSLSLLLFFLIFLFLSSSMFYFCRIWWKWVQFWIQWMRIESLRQQRHLLGSRWWIPVYLPSRFRRSSLPDSSKNRIATTNYRKLNSIARYDWIIYIHQRATNQLLLRRLRIMHRWSLES